MFILLMVSFIGDAICLLPQCSAFCTHSISVSLLSRSLSPSFRLIKKKLANLFTLSLFWINYSESHRLRFTLRLAHNVCDLDLSANIIILRHRWLTVMKLVDIVFVGLVKTSNFLFNELTVAKSEFFKPFLRFLCFIKKVFFTKFC
jgi:hypothetical protein